MSHCIQLTDASYAMAMLLNVIQKKEKSNTTCPEENVSAHNCIFLRSSERNYCYSIKEIILPSLTPSVKTVKTQEKHFMLRDQLNFNQNI